MKKILSIVNISTKLIILLLVVGLLSRVTYGNGNERIINENQNKTLDLTSMAFKFNEIQLQDIYAPLDTFTGDLTGYAADCALCTGYLSCNNQYVANGTTSYYDATYGNVQIVASSKNLPCGSVISYNSPYDNSGLKYAIVLDRGVLSTDIDLLVQSEAYASANIGRHKITYNVLRFGWTRG